jgi:peptidoglycan-N-acetylglucosamine deacetylase
MKQYNWQKNLYKINSVKMAKRKATISLDLDNQWSYMKIHGNPGWKEYPSYFDIFVPYVLEILDELDLKISFFIVGQDAAQEKNKGYLKMIVDRGHEICNHSFNHESWLQKYSREELWDEISNAENAIYNATGTMPKGFRGPGFSCSQTLFEILAEKGYDYDCSSLPTFIGPLARKYYFWTSDLTKEEKKLRNELFGKFTDGFKPLKPYKMKLKNGKELLEIPVTTMPIFRTPFHLSYLIYLNNISRPLMRIYYGMATGLCKLTNTPPSFLLHPLDIIGGDKIKELAFFPGMNVASDKKVAVFKKTIQSLKNNFELMPMGKYVDEIKVR